MRVFSGQGIVQLAHELQAIGERRQAILIGERLVGLMGPYAFGNIVLNGDKVRDFPVVVKERRNDLCRGIETPILASIDDISLPAFTR